MVVPRNLKNIQLSGSGEENCTMEDHSLNLSITIPECLKFVLCLRERSIDGVEKNKHHDNLYISE